MVTDKIYPAYQMETERENGLVDLHFVLCIDRTIGEWNRDQDWFQSQTDKFSSGAVAQGQSVGLVIQCLHWGRGSIPTPGAHSAAIPLGKGFTVHYLVFSDGT